jgi:hypothetical protein
MIGLGSVTGMGSTLRALQIPPGKSMTWPGTTAAATASATTLSSTSTGSTTNPPLYLQPSTSNPGGLAGYNHQAYFTYKTVNGRMTGVPLNLGRVSTGARVGSGSYWPSSTRPSSASTSPSMSGATSFASTSPAATTDVLEGISGYVYGFLTYPSYVTQGTYTGTTLLTSPNFGLVERSRGRRYRGPCGRGREGTLTQAFPSLRLNEPKPNRARSISRRPARRAMRDSRATPSLPADAARRPGCRRRSA